MLNKTKQSYILDNILKYLIYIILTKLAHFYINNPTVKLVNQCFF